MTATLRDKPIVGTRTRTNGFYSLRIPGTGRYRLVIVPFASPDTFRVEVYSYRDPKTYDIFLLVDHGKRIARVRS